MNLERVLLLHLDGIRCGAEVRICCPKCDDEKHHLYVRPSKSAFICFRCGWGGPLGRLLQHLAQQLPPGTDLESLPDTPVLARPVIPRELPLGAEPLWLSDSPAAPAARSYLVSRGVPESEHAAWQAHFSIAGDVAWRVILPVIEDGRVINWTARSYVGGEPRYLNPRKGETLRSRSECVFGLDLVPLGIPQLLILEGPLNAMVMGAGVVALMGKAWSTTQVDKLLQKRALTYLVGLDRDASGSVVKLTGRIEPGEGLGLARELASRGARVSIVPWPSAPKRDAADMGRQGAWDWVRAHSLPWNLATEAQMRMGFLKDQRPVGFQP